MYSALFIASVCDVTCARQNIMTFVHLHMDLVSIFKLKYIKSKARTPHL